MPKTHGFGMRKWYQKFAPKWPFLAAAGGIVFGMAGFIASDRKWPLKRTVSRVAKADEVMSRHRRGSAFDQRAQASWQPLRARNPYASKADRSTDLPG
jgi:hypothetical protein